MSEKVITWYIEPIGAHTNEALARELPEENAQRGLPDKNGKRHDVWECPYSIISRFMRSRKKCKLTFEVYKQVNKGKIFQSNNLARKMVFGKRRKKKQSATKKEK